MADKNRPSNKDLGDSFKMIINQLLLYCGWDIDQSKTYSAVRDKIAEVTGSLHLKSPDGRVDLAEIGLIYDGRWRVDSNTCVEWASFVDGLDTF